METAIKPLLLLFILLYVMFVFVGRTLIVWRKTKKFPITYGKTDSAHDYLGNMFKLLLGLSLCSSAIYFISEALYTYLIPLPALEVMPVRLLGLILAYASMLWIMVAQAQMGLSWRIGIDTEQKTEMVRRGLFKVSRHPIYFGVTITALSLFLSMPNVFNLILFLMTALTLAVQARLEEEFLTQAYGDDYLQYRTATRRWL